MEHKKAGRGKVGKVDPQKRTTARDELTSWEKKYPKKGPCHPARDETHFNG